ncbi:5220_t:CDS:2 [Paraglomus occultum]|uniref:5220_t:CDS:1 n=1 Tax=Paraglomus occultum TaxID=144539 RepID=A0A9N8WUS3_9GLOM|nr:5220_t:CDS:2 [Paraglomus occultum]
MRSKSEVFSLYRALIRAGDASVLHSRPAVYDVRRRLRQAFNEYRYVDDEKEQDDLFERGENMKRLFKIAARRGGPEHKSIVNLCEMAFFDKLYARR